MPLRSNDVIAIKNLIDRGGMTQSEIAAVAGVSQPTVSKIAGGCRTETASRLPRQKYQGSNVPKKTKPERCPTCRGMVYMPCVLCAVVDFNQRHVRSAA